MITIRSKSLIRKLALFILLGITGYSPSFAQSLSDTLTIDEVVVTGMRVEVARKNTPFNITVIPERRINEIAESAILPMLSRSVPGVFVNERGVTGFGRDGSSSAGNITIRGVGGSPNAQVLVLVDGHPQYMGIFGHPLPNNYVASDLERVEIIKGPASILYGSNAMGGVLNLITKKQKKDGISGSARLGYGSFNTKKMMASAGYKKGKFDFFLSYNHDDTDGHREYMDFLIDNAYVKTGYRLTDNFKLSADFNIADLTSHDPGRIMDTTEVFEANMLRGKASVSLSNHFEKFDGSILAYYNFGEHDFSDGWMSNDENYGLTIYEGFRMFEGSLITIGFDYKSYGGRGNIAFPPTYADQWLTVDETAGYLIAQQKIYKDIILLNAGMRLENNSMFGSEWIPQAGLTAKISDNFNFKSLVSEGFRSPTIMELYLFAPNQELEPERSMNYEAGIEKIFPDIGLSTELTFFLIEGENIIQSQPNPNPPPMFKRFNSGTFRHQGFEIETKYRPGKNLAFDLNYSFLSMDTPRLAAPEHQLFAGINYNWEKFRFALQSHYVGGLYILTAGMEDATEDIIENYLLLNASAKYQMNKYLEFFLSAKNILDQEYTIDYGYPMPGINFMAGVGVKF